MATGQIATSTGDDLSEGLPVAPERPQVGGAVGVQGAVRHPSPAPSPGRRQPHPLPTDTLGAEVSAMILARFTAA